MTLAQAVRDAKRACLERALREAGGHVTKAAQLAGVNRTAFYRLAARYGVFISKGQYGTRGNRGNAEWQRLSSH